MLLLLYIYGSSDYTVQTPQVSSLDNMKLVHTYEPEYPEYSKQVFDLIKRSH